MNRNVMQKLIEWKKSPERKPLILKGARQVGKTWLMKEFGAKYYNNYAYFSFDEEKELSSIFEKNKNPHRIIELLGVINNQVIKPKETLIIFDEIQECPDALNSLKYFNEKANEYHVISAGSLLGTLLTDAKSYPVGQVNLINLYPLTFDEFLAVLDESLFNYYKEIHKGQQIEEIFHTRLLDIYNYYLIIGGLPECVTSWKKYKDPQRIMQIQNELIQIYENDFTKHNKKIDSIKILQIFRSLVSQLSKSNEKFLYGCVKSGARAREYETGIEWLVSAGLVYRVYNVTKPEHPLKAHDQLNNFKLFLFDTGLLKHMAGVDNSTILLKSDYQFKGPLTENYVLQQLQDKFIIEPRFYLYERSEIDFLIQHHAEIIPVEVKGGTNKIASSFKSYIKNKVPRVAIRYSKLGYVTDGKITNIPLYLTEKTDILI